MAHFTTPEGQFGLPRDLNLVGLYYNKAMFDAAGIPYPDDTWTWDTLVDVGKQLTLDKDGDGQTDQWGFYTETTDMENYWSELVWQNGGDIVSADRTKTLLGTDEAIGGIQQLQDLIYTHKIMPPASVTAILGDAFEQGQAAMESNGSWLVPTHLAAGIDLGIAPLPAGPAGDATSINPTGVVVAKNTAAARRRLGVREVPRRAGGADPADAAQGGRAGRQERPRGQLRDGVPGQRRLRCHDPGCRPEAVVPGLQRVDGSPPGGAESQRLRRPLKTAREAIESVLPELDEILAKQAQ